MTSIFAGAFAFSIGFDVGVTKFWDSWNRGVGQVFLEQRPVPFPFPTCLTFLTSRSRFVQKQWKDIRHRYIQEADSE